MERKSIPFWKRPITYVVSLSIVGSIAIIIASLIIASKNDKDKKNTRDSTESSNNPLTAASSTGVDEPQTVQSDSNAQVVKPAVQPPPRPGGDVSTRACNPAFNFVAGVPYDQRDLQSFITYDDAVAECRKVADGKSDFFVQQHGSGHTVCGLFNRELTASDNRIPGSGGHRFAAVCAKK